jgi:hypothetical protein
MYKISEKVCPRSESPTLSQILKGRREGYILQGRLIKDMRRAVVGRVSVERTMSNVKESE